MKKKRITRFGISAAILFLAYGSRPAPAQTSPDFLAGNTVLIVRHAEKPLVGDGLTTQGEARARAYVRYFEPFREEQFDVTVDGLYSGADSMNSHRPRLTLEPLSKAANLQLHTGIGSRHADELVAELRSTAHGRAPLIAWRHSQIPALLKAFGASPEKLLPGGTWPDDVFDNVIVLRFDGKGKLVLQQTVHEHLKVIGAP